MVHHRAPPSSTTTVSGTTLHGGQLSEIARIFREWVYNMRQFEFLLIFAFRINKRGCFYTMALPLPLEHSNNSQVIEIPQACCWDFHLFLASRDDNVSPWLHISDSARYEHSPVTQELREDNAKLEYLYSRFKRTKTKAELGDGVHEISYGLQHRLRGERLTISTIRVHWIMPNATSNANQVEASHFTSQRPFVGALTSAAFQSGSSVQVDYLDVLGTFGLWHAPRPYGPSKDRPEIERRVEQRPRAWIPSASNAATAPQPRLEVYQPRHNGRKATPSWRLAGGHAAAKRIRPANHAAQLLWVEQVDANPIGFMPETRDELPKTATDFELDEEPQHQQTAVDDDAAAVVAAAVAHNNNNNDDDDIQGFWFSHPSEFQPQVLGASLHYAGNNDNLPEQYDPLLASLGGPPQDDDTPTDIALAIWPAPLSETASELLYDFLAYRNLDHVIDFMSKPLSDS